ncbi:TIGR04282 family arsenosugar biosynthesis glycosyltransferase [Aliifodinibius salicampi]|uniref:TIGR04282 family arsenosugar biosynthesis glycosyltransferase n=1 Tax=Fodinibius salicampi TaxID=1920655 RepID=A0ABT3PZP2_9BACT|nr:TIGR04282 family arsenosugar biosynthesis glycosyltransferase [Fodinibius salicampi]MCW9713333.1 TIGR04282 family arsenosugar biosynthesis glycosyltransferase [Fodinibius salicampi]
MDNGNTNINGEGQVLMVFTKNPKLGKVKTRLARTIGEEQALSVYKELLRLTKSVTDPLQVTKQLWYSSFISRNDIWPGDIYDKRLQKGRDLGKRMQHAFQKAFDESFEKAVIIGSDCSALTTDIIRQAFRALDNHRVVIGPARDGGYYLLGMSEYYPEVFTNKSWSTPSVFEKTIEQLREMDISYSLLPMLNDIDTLEDLKASKLSHEL